MKDYHPADTRYRPSAQSQRATPIRTYLTDRATPAPHIKNLREDRQQAKQAGQDAYGATMRKAPIWKNFIPFGAQWVQLRAENARNAARGKTPLYTIMQIVGALVVYALLVSVSGTGMVRL